VADLDITASLLDRAARRNGYSVPPAEMVFFGVRGFSPQNVFDNTFGASQPGRFAEIDYRRQRCTLGQWNVATGQIALFPGSTVPSLPNIRSRQEGRRHQPLDAGKVSVSTWHAQGRKGKRHRAFHQAMFRAYPVDADTPQG
jgi:hypothetical protein